MLIIIPATICLLIKLYVLKVSFFSESKHQNAFFILIAFLAFNNSAEILMRGFFQTGLSQTFWLKIYYVSLVGGITAILIYSFKVAQLKKNINVVRLFVILMAIITSLIILFSNKIIMGDTIINGLPNALRGDWYWLLRLHIYTVIISILTLLIVSYSRSKNHLHQNQCLYLLIAVVPLVLIGAFLLYAIPRGHFPNSGVVLLPIASTFFTVALLKTEAKHGLLDIRRHVPYSLERTTAHDLQDVLAKYSMEELNHKEAMNDIERSLVTYKNKKTGNNISHAAKSMDVPRSTLYAILKRLNIKDEKTEG